MAFLRAAFAMLSLLTLGTFAKTPFATLRFFNKQAVLDKDHCLTIQNTMIRLMQGGKINTAAMNMMFRCQPTNQTIEVFSEKPTGTLSAITTMYVGMNTIASEANLTCGTAIALNTTRMVSLFGCQKADAIAIVRKERIPLYTTTTFERLCC